MGYTPLPGNFLLKEMSVSHWMLGYPIFIQTHMGLSENRVHPIFWWLMNNFPHEHGIFEGIPWWYTPFLDEPICPSIYSSYSMIFSIRGRQNLNSAKQNSSTCLSKMIPLHGPSKIAATHGRIDDVQLKVPALGTKVCKLAMLLAISKPQPTSNGSKMNLGHEDRWVSFPSVLLITY